MRVLQFRHDCQNLGCANLSCNLCKLCQRRRCEGNFAAKYLAPCDVVEAKCGAQIYVVVVDTATGQLVQSGLDDACLQIGLIDGRKFEAEGSREEVLDDCLLLLNKQGQPLLVHGRSGTYTDDKRIIIPMIHGQAILPDLKITDSSEALLTGRAPPFRLVVRAVRRSGEPLPGIVPALSEPFVVATARVKGAAKLEIPHLEDHVSKIECVGVQTQKKLEDIRAASVAANVPDLHLPINSVTKVGQFRELVEMAERSKPLRETLKQVLRLTKGWDVARDHVRRAVDTDIQLRTYCPDGRTDVGLVFKCGAFNVIDINHPIGLLRRKQNPSQPNQELVDIIWLPRDITACPEAVRKMLPQASAAWWRDGHPGWSFLPLNTSHMPAYSETGHTTVPTSSFTFTIRSGPVPLGVPPIPAAQPPAVGAAAAGATPGMVPVAPPAPAAPSSGTVLAGFGGLVPVGPTGALPASFLHQGGPQQQQQAPGQSARGMSGGMPPPAPTAAAAANPFGGLSGVGAGGLVGLQPLGGGGGGPGGTLGDFGGGLLDGFGGGQLGGMHAQFGGVPLIPAMPLGQQPGGAPASAAAGGAAAAGAGAGSAPPVGGLPGVGAGAFAPGGMLALRGLGLPEIPSIDLFNTRSMAIGSEAPTPSLPSSGPGAALPKQDSASPFEDPAFQNLMAMVAANQPGSGGGGGGGEETGGEGTGARQKDGKSKRKAETSLDNWVAMHKSLELDISLPPNLAQLSSLFTSLLVGNEMTPELLRELLPQQRQQAQQAEHDCLPPLGAMPTMSPPTQPAAAAAPAQEPQQQQQQQQEEEEAPTGPAVVPPPAAGEMPPPPVPSSVAAAVEQQAQQPAAVVVKTDPELGATSAAGPVGPVAPPPAAAAPGPAPATAAAAIAGVSLEQLQNMFQAAAKQEISYDQLEGFLRQHNLLPTGQPQQPPEQGGGQ